MENKKSKKNYRRRKKVDKKTVNKNKKQKKNKKKNVERVEKVEVKKEEKLDNKQDDKDFEEINLYNFVKLLVLILITVILIIFISNKTFFSNKFSFKSEDKIVSIKIPRFSYLREEDDNKLVFKTIRNKKTLKEYFEKYLAKDFIIYKCNNGKVRYYNERDKYTVYDFKIDEDSKFIKTYSLKYTTIDYNLICEIN